MNLKLVVCICGVSALIGVELLTFTCKECHHENLVHVPHREYTTSPISSIVTGANETVEVSPSSGPDGVG